VEQAIHNQDYITEVLHFSLHVYFSIVLNASDMFHH
jgi:hypothetical protein